MQTALEEARHAADRGEVPVGAVVVHNNQIIARDGNRVEERNDPTAHAELLVLAEARARLGKMRLPDCDLYVTLEPCTMCAGAISLSRVRRLYYGAQDPKGGAVENGVRFFNQATCHHAPDVYSEIAAQECEALLKRFFQTLRD